jgi:hypothetical protein
MIYGVAYDTKSVLSGEPVAPRGAAVFVGAVSLFLDPRAQLLVVVLITQQQREASLD